MTSPSSVEAKLDRYNRFWSRAPVERPLIGFSVGGWFPLRSYRALERLRGKRALSPDGLYLQIVVETAGDARGWRDFFRPWI